MVKPSKGGVSTPWLDMGGAATATTIRASEQITTLGLAPMFRLYPGTWRVLGIGLTPLGVEAGDSDATSGTFWALTSTAHAFLRLGAFEVSGDVPIQHWRGNRDWSLGTPLLLRFGWGQQL